MRECLACGLVQLDPLPDDSLRESLYGDRYFESDAPRLGYGDYGSQEAEYLATFAEDLQRIAAFVSGGTALDVGCGYGYFLAAAQAAGFTGYGVDVSAHAVEVAAKRFPGRVYPGLLQEVDALRGRRFDLVFASHVVEHVVDPIGFVRQLAEHVAPSGALVLVTPDIGSLLARISGRRWVSFKIPEHVAYYSRATLRRVVEAAELDVLAMDPAFQHYRLPFVARRLRELISPLDRLIPRLEDLPALRQRTIRVTSGSLRVIARPRAGRAAGPGAGAAASPPA